MPTRPARGCNKPACRWKTSDHNSYCLKHQKEADKARLIELAQRRPQDQRDRIAYYKNRGSPSKRGYGRRHQAWRLQILARDPYCKICFWRPATIADHIKPMASGGEPLDMENGQGLCEGCHGRKTVLEDGGFGRPAVVPAGAG